MLDNLPSKLHFPLINPVPNSILFFKELYEPTELFSVTYFFDLSPFVFRFTEPPKADPPLVEVPTPLCICILLTEEVKSGIFTHQTP